jgi:hypothetical protein
MSFQIDPVPMSEMISFERMLVAGLGGLFVSCFTAAAAGFLILASACREWAIAAATADAPTTESRSS